MSKSPLIGALVGMGPKSTTPFYEAVIEEARVQYGAKHDMDFPALVMFSLPTPFVPGESIDEELMKEQLHLGVKTLLKAGVQLIAVPCNLVHLYYDYISELAGSVPVLNIITLAVDAISNIDNKPIAILGTEPIVRAKLYQRKIAEKGGIAFIDDLFQRQINKLIMLIKSHGVKCKSVKDEWAMMCSYIKKAGCNSMLIACTDITPCARAYGTKNLTFVDSTEALTRQFVFRYMSLRRGNL